MKTDTQTDLAFATIKELAPQLRKKQISPVELTHLYLSRIEGFNGRLHAFLSVTVDRALAQARTAERELLRGRWRGPLHGIPIALKDNIWTRGIRTTAGSVILRDFLPDEDATVVRRLRRAGTVLLGKTNLHEFAYGITSENPHFGPVRNPWATDRITGGSSGGSAAAVAAGLCAAAIGSDTGGSIRIPAALCGVVGLKPTFGRVSVHGVIPLAPSFDHVGPMARCATDVAWVLEAIAGRDPLDPTSIPRPHPNFLSDAAKRKKRRLGIPREYFWTRIDGEVRRMGEDALRNLARQGADIEEISLPSTREAVEAANLIAAVEAREVHEKAGHFPARASDYGADVRRRLERGGEVLALDYRKAQEVVLRSCAEFATALGRVDAVAAPTTPVAAPLIGSELVRIGNVEETVRSALLRANRPANFTGLPAISIPCGFTHAGLPVGLELIGRRFDEGTLLGIGRLYEDQHHRDSHHPRLD